VNNKGRPSGRPACFQGDRRVTSNLSLPKRLGKGHRVFRLGKAEHTKSLSSCAGSTSAASPIEHRQRRISPHFLDAAHLFGRKRDIMRELRNCPWPRPFRSPRFISPLRRVIAVSPSASWLKSSHCDRFPEWNLCRSVGLTTWGATRLRRPGGLAFPGPRHRAPRPLRCRSPRAYFALAAVHRLRAS
jgi:hypothetical protein